MTKLQSTERDEELFEGYCPAESGSTVSDILPQAINQQQDAQGSIYIFNWPRKPRFLKMGYAKASWKRETILGNSITQRQLPYME